MADLLTEPTPAETEARERRLWDRAVCAQMRILLDNLAIAHRQAEARNDPVAEAIAARIRCGIAAERELVTQNGGPSVDYVPRVQREGE